MSRTGSFERKDACWGERKGCVGVAVVLPPPNLRRSQGWQYNCHPNDVARASDKKRHGLVLLSGKARPMATVHSGGEARLAIEGGPKAFAAMAGKRQPKIGVEEFLAIAQRFGFSARTLDRLRAIVSDDDLGRGPTLGAVRHHVPPPERGRGLRAPRPRNLRRQVRPGRQFGHGARCTARLVAAGVGPGSEVIVPAIGFFATAAAVVAARGVPVFCDVDQSLHIDPAKIEAKITPRTVAMVPTCVMGGVPDLEPILAVARRHNSKVIEDCRPIAGGEVPGPLRRHVGRPGLLQHLGLQDRRRRRGRAAADQRRAPVRAGLPVGRMRRVVASRSLRPATLSGRTVLRHQLPHVRAGSRRRRGAVAEDARVGRAVQRQPAGDFRPVEDLPRNRAAKAQRSAGRRGIQHPLLPRDGRTGAQDRGRAECRGNRLRRVSLAGRVRHSRPAGAARLARLSRHVPRDSAEPIRPTPVVRSLVRCTGNGAARPATEAATVPWPKTFSTATS